MDFFLVVCMIVTFNYNIAQMLAYLLCNFTITSDLI